MQLSEQTYIIAEAGVNHNGDRDKAFALVDVAIKAGANAVKFQTFNAAKLAGAKTAKAAYQKRVTDEAESQLAMLSKLELPHQWHIDLQQHCRQQGIDFLSTAFDVESLAFLNKLNLPIYKIASGEITNSPLLWRYGQLGKPLILSTGMSSIVDIDRALSILGFAFCHSKLPSNTAEILQNYSLPSTQKILQNNVLLLHCTSQYPTPNDQVNLAALTTMQQTFKLAVGYSDHTQGNTVAIGAVALGAKVIEKHFTLDKSLPGPDHQASLTPQELYDFVASIRQIELAFGNGIKQPQPCEWDTRMVARQSLIAARDIEIDHIWQFDDFETQRVGQGTEPHNIWDLIGQKATKNYSDGETI